MNNEKIGRKVINWMTDNIVTIIFVLFTLFGFIVSSGVSLNFFLTELSERIFRNAFLILSLIIPVIAGLGLNFGIVVGAMSGQIAIVIVRYFNIGGLSGLLLCFLIALPIAAFCGWLTGLLYNKTRGQEMIASLIVGFFANGVYYFLFLFAVGVIIPVSADHPMIKPDGIGIRMTVDLETLKYALDDIFQIPFMVAILIIAIGLLIYTVIQHLRDKKDPGIAPTNPWLLGLNILVYVFLVGLSLFSIFTDSSLMMVRKVPVVTALIILALCLFTNFLMKTKLGQDFRAVGQSQRIAQVSGINVDKTRIIAVILSTVFAAWGQILYLQNMGTLNTYNAHTQIGMFSVAALLVGGASTAKATVKHALIGTVLFNAMFIMSPEIGQALFGNALLGEYFRTFMVYGVIGVALGLYVWKAAKKTEVEVED